MRWIKKHESVPAGAMLAALVCACMVLSGVAANVEPAPQATAVSTSTTTFSAAQEEPAALPKTPHFGVELLSAPAEQSIADLLVAPVAETEESAEEGAEEPAEPEILPVFAQYALENEDDIRSSKSATYIPENLAACTADADIPENLIRFDSFIATAYTVTGQTSTGTQTTVGRTIAVNPAVVPYGTHVWMFLDDGTFVGDFIAEDTGSNMQAHPHVIDVYMGENTTNECLLWGAQHVTLYVEPTEAE